MGIDGLRLGVCIAESVAADFQEVDRQVGVDFMVDDGIDIPAHLNAVLNVDVGGGDLHALGQRVIEGQRADPDLVAHCRGVLPVCAEQRDIGTVGHALGMPVVRIIPLRGTQAGTQPAIDGDDAIGSSAARPVARLYTTMQPSAGL